MHKIKNSMKDSIVVVLAKVHDNLCVEQTFSDGHKNIVDIGDFIRRHPHPQNGLTHLGILIQSLTTFLQY